MRKLRQQRRGLKLVEPAVSSSRPAHLVLFVPAILAQLAKPFGQRGIACRHRSAIAERAEILGWIKAEAAGVTKAARRLPVAGRTVRLGAVLDDGNPERPADGGNRLD